MQGPEEWDSERELERYLRRDRTLGFLERLIVIKALEKAVDAHPVEFGDYLLARIANDPQVRAIQAKAGIEAVREWLVISQQTEFARDKLAAYRVGLIHAKQRGDLRDWEMECDQRAQVLAVLRLRHGRTSPAARKAFQEEAGKLDPGFLAKAARVLKEEALDFEHCQGTPLQDFVLFMWDREMVRGDAYYAPLFLCSDPVIAKLAGHWFHYALKGEIGEGTPPDPKTVEKTWTRLGLKKCRKIKFWSLPKKGGRFLFSPLRHRRS